MTLFRSEHCGPAAAFRSEKKMCEKNCFSESERQSSEENFSESLKVSNIKCTSVIINTSKRL